MRSRQQRPPPHPLRHYQPVANLSVKLPPLAQPTKQAGNHRASLEYSLKRINLLDCNSVRTVVPLNKEYSVLKQKAKWLVEKNKYSRDQFVLRKTCLSADNATKTKQIDLFYAEKQRVKERDVGPWGN